MERVGKTLVPLLVAGIAAAMPPLFATSHDLCFTAGPVTYRLSDSAPSPDYRVRIDNAATRPDLRVRLVDRVELADLTLVDDVGSDRPCSTLGVLRTVRIVGGPADVTVSVSREVRDADFALYVHSARITDQDAAALFALMRHVQAPAKIAHAR